MRARSASEGMPLSRPDLRGQVQAACATASWISGCGDSASLEAHPCYARTAAGAAAGARSRGGHVHDAAAGSRQQRQQRLTNRLGAQEVGRQRVLRLLRPESGAFVSDACSGTEERRRGVKGGGCGATTITAGKPWAIFADAGDGRGRRWRSCRALARPGSPALLTSTSTRPCSQRNQSSSAAIEAAQVISSCCSCSRASGAAACSFCSAARPRSSVRAAPRGR